MQINIDKKTGIFSGVIVVLIAVIIGLSINPRGHNGFFGMNHSKMSDDKKSSSTALKGADIMFLQMMIPHHQQAVDISNLALTKSKDSELIALATSIRDGQADEIAQMKQWLKDADADIDMGHMMHDSMGGMLAESELSALDKATGKDFDRLWLQGMIGHHDGALQMVKMINNSKNSEIKKFGEKIFAAQSSEIAQMQSMLQRIG